MAATAVDIAIDAVASVAASTVQFGSPQAAVVLPVVAGDLLYAAGIKTYIDREFGGAGAPLADQFSRDIAAKTAIVTLVSFVTNQFLGGEVDILGAAINAAVTFTAGNGIKEALYIQ